MESESNMHGVTFSKDMDFLTSTPIVFSFQEIKREVRDAISYAENVINWIERFPKANKTKLDVARILLDWSKTKYSKGKLDEALRLSEKNYRAPLDQNRW